ncbi:junctional adhesion molecule A-like protein [Labeo rohita]|uniref:Junctional adhesion molecule A-like protein n=1 Tax=Labeo rohita TaxID=84645 RepID=A0A498LEK3_LABRO|nr:junctional adhesion molecule A-like protein [Labeo rohita]
MKPGNSNYIQSNLPWPKQRPRRIPEGTSKFTFVGKISDAFIEKKRGKIKNNNIDGEIGEDGSLTFKSVSLKDSGKYKYSAFNNDGTEIGAGEEEIKVYAKVPKPIVMVNCKNGNATLTCDIGDRTDLTVSWYKENKTIQNEENPQMFLTSAQVQENKPYTCRVPQVKAQVLVNSLALIFGSC